jgi:hypothetical protein
LKRFPTRNIHQGGGGGNNKYDINAEIKEEIFASFETILVTVS